MTLAGACILSPTFGSCVLFCLVTQSSKHIYVTLARGCPTFINNNIIVLDFYKSRIYLKTYIISFLLVIGECDGLNAKIVQVIK